MQVTLHKKYETFCKKCLTSPCGSGNINKLSQGIASEILKNKLVFRKFRLTVDNRLNLWQSNLVAKTDKKMTAAQHFGNVKKTYEKSS